MEANGVSALGALGDPTRRAIFECLARQPMAVGQIAELLPVTRPAVSQHLKVLKQAGLVIDEAIGTKRIYRVRSDGLQAIQAYLDQMWGQALAGFRLAAEQMAAVQVPAQQVPAQQVPAQQVPAQQVPAQQLAEQATRDDGQEQS